MNVKSKVLALMLLAVVGLLAIACAPPDPEEAASPPTPAPEVLGAARDFAHCGEVVAAALAEHKHTYVDSSSDSTYNTARLTRDNIWFPDDVRDGLEQHCKEE